MPPRPGAFAELIRIPERNLVPIPDACTAERAALAEPLAVSYHAVQQARRHLATPLDGARCCVLGGGAIGLAAALVLAMECAGEILVGETSPDRRRTVERSGDFVVYGPGEAGEPDASSVDLVVDAVGARATREAASRMVRPGGVIVHVGLLPGQEGLDIRKLTLEEVVLTGTYCYTHAEFCTVVDAIAADRLGALDWFDTRALAEGAAAFADIDRGRLPVAKLVLRP